MRGKTDLAEENFQLRLDLAEARQVARELWLWALWNDKDRNDAYCVTSMEELEALRTDPKSVAKYEEWRWWREGKSHRYEWLRAQLF